MATVASRLRSPRTGHFVSWGCPHEPGRFDACDKWCATSGSDLNPTLGSACEGCSASTSTTGHGGCFRCCSMPPLCTTHSGATSGHDHATAESFCASLGKRLCTAAEIDMGLCCGTGCGADHQLVWTSDECSSSIGYTCNAREYLASPPSTCSGPRYLVGASLLSGILIACVVIFAAAIVIATLIFIVKALSRRRQRKRDALGPAVVAVVRPSTSAVPKQSTPSEQIPPSRGSGGLLRPPSTAKASRSTSSRRVTFQEPVEADDPRCNPDLVLTSVPPTPPPPEPLPPIELPHDDNELAEHSSSACIWTAPWRVLALSPPPAPWPALQRARVASARSQGLGEAAFSDSASEGTDFGEPDSNAITYV